MLRKVAQVSTAAMWIAGCAAISSLAAENSAIAPDFQQVFELIKQNLPDAAEGELNRAATEGFIGKLSPRVTLVRAGEKSETASLGLTRSNLFDNSVLYLRVGGLAPGLDETIKTVWEQFSPSNKAGGVVLDLRYAKGDDYSVAVSVARLFLQAKQPLLDWGEGMAEAMEVGPLGTCPVVTLVNRETSGAAETLAAVLRGVGRGLILGARTAGKAGVVKEFALANGDRLQIVTRAIRLGDGSEIKATGVVPDIEVEVSPSAEKVYYEDPFALPQLGAQTSAGGLAGSRTNQPLRRPRYGEAELVRDRRQGLPVDADAARQRAEPEAPQLQDAVLVRALDLLKGLAIVRQTRS